MKLQIVVETSIRPRTNCRPGRSVFTNSGRLTGLKNISAMRNALTKRSATTCSGIHVAAEIFRDGVERGEQRHRAAHQPDADQPLAALLVRGVAQ